MSRAVKSGAQALTVSKILHSLGVISMVSIDEELKAAKAAKAAMDQLSTSATPTKIALVRTLRAANTAGAVLNVGSGGALNEARTNVGIALSNVINRSPTLETIEKAKAAIDAWIKELEAAKG